MNDQQTASQKNSQSDSVADLAMDLPKNHRGDILIVDDAPDNLYLMTQILSQQGYRIRTANSGERALIAVQEHIPDLVLLDIMMPNMSGFEVCEHLKADERTRDSAIIFVSVKNETRDKVKALSVGGVDYITKPFHAGEVIARVQTHMILRETQKDLAKKNAQLEQKIIERERAERALHRHAERLKILHEIDQSILAAQSPGTIALAAIGRIRRLIPCQRALAMAITETGQIEALAVESSGEIKMDADVDVYQEMFRDHPLSQGWIQGSDDMDTLVRDSPLLQVLYAAGVRSYMAVPLFIHGELVGSLNLESNRPGVFTSGHIAIATEVAVLLAVAIRQAHLYEQAQRERQKANELLLNILPANVANDLRETGKTTPRSFENVTVCFSDIVNFTTISSQHEPEFIIGELNEMFTAFDNIMEKNQCERIKTIGDAYMAVCGMPEENENHARNIVQAAIEIINYIQDRNEQSQVKWQIRIGIHSGEVVGGVVGVKKYIYDVFGDAVNTAGRMESHSNPMRINVSEYTCDLVKGQFDFIEREAITVKGKGEMRMYFVEDRHNGEP